MICPKCDAQIQENSTECPYCNTTINQEKIQREESKKTYTNADCLNFMSVINIVISIIGAIIVWANFSTITYARGYSETNWFGVIGGLAILIVGFTQFFLLKTVVDIYDKEEK